MAEEIGGTTAEAGSASDTRTGQHISIPNQADQQNLRAIGLMVFSMLCFAIEDMLIKLASSDLSVGQILLILGLIGGIFSLVLAQLRKERLTKAIATNHILWARTICEMAGTFGFVMALALIPLSNAAAILRATPLVVTIGAAFILKEPIGWRRWTAVSIGFIGVLMIIQPGSDVFDINSLFAVLGVLGMGLRDVLTRRVPNHIPTTWVSTLGFFAGAVLGALLLAGPQEWHPMLTGGVSILIIASILGIAGYFAITTAARIGETSAIAPFRYSRLVFALIIGFVVFAERPDGWMLAGSCILIATGIYSIYRERINTNRTVQT